MILAVARGRDTVKSIEQSTRNAPIDPRQIRRTLTRLREMGLVTHRDMHTPNGRYSEWVPKQPAKFRKGIVLKAKRVLLRDKYKRKAVT